VLALTARADVFPEPVVGVPPRLRVAIAVGTATAVVLTAALPRLSLSGGHDAAFAHPSRATAPSPPPTEPGAPSAGPMAGRQPSAVEHLVLIAATAAVAPRPTRVGVDRPTLDAEAGESPPSGDAVHPPRQAPPPRCPALDGVLGPVAAIVMLPCLTAVGGDLTGASATGPIVFTAQALTGALAS